MASLPPSTPTRRNVMFRVGLLALALGSIALTAWCCRGLFVHRATAQPVSGQQSAATPETAPSTPTDYTTRVVAYVHGSQAITRQDLGEYLIPRLGAEKLPLLLNRRLVDAECRRRGVSVSSAEVEAAFAEDLKGMALDLNSFVKNYLPRAKKNLYEWKEDVLRPRLQMTRLVSERIQITADDLRKAYETVYGEKVECRMILWPHEQAQKAMDAYAQLRDSETAFSQAAQSQPTSDLASTGGKIKPIARHAMHPDLEREAFKLQPGQVSTLIKTPQGIALLRCDKRIPADTAMSLEAARPRLEAQIREQKLQVEMASLFAALREQAQPRPLLTKNEHPAPGSTAPSAPVAYLRGGEVVTRQELGEFLIARFGTEKLEFLVNRRVIDLECKNRGISVSEAELDRRIEDDLKMLNCDKKHFEKELLGKMNKSMYEYREDMIRPEMLLTRLCEGRVKCTEEDLKKGFDAYHGERLECRVILWPPDQAKYAMAEYSQIRDSEQEFARKARTQPSPTLAAQGGKIPVFGKSTLGDENLEREAFKLQPGEVSTLIGTAQGQVVIKCDRRIPPDTNVTLDQVRDRLTQETIKRKTQQEMQVIFKELRDKANPKLILAGSAQWEDLAAESRKLLAETQLPGGKAPPK